jgi:DNA-directed RNA polymerase specialized sigma24 family protein
MGSRRTDVDRSITAAGLAQLLARLHAGDAERAALEYERLRRALVKFFDWRGGCPPEDCADETLDRLARKLEGETLVDNVQSYAHGIARLVLLERRRQPAFASIEDAPDPASFAAAVEDEEDERRQGCLERCLAAMSEESRVLVLAYYEGERQGKIANRRRLAEARGLTESALRSRVQRVRDRLERCVQGCLSAQGAAPGAASRAGGEADPGADPGIAGVPESDA